MNYKPRDFEKEFVLCSIKDILQNIKDHTSVAILHEHDTYSTKMAENIKQIKEDFIGPCTASEFNGLEADVIIFVTSEQNFVTDIVTVARARRLLILVTLIADGYWNDDSVCVKVMNQAVEQKLVKKISYQPISQLQGNLSEDEALARALQASMSETTAQRHQHHPMEP